MSHGKRKTKATERYGTATVRTTVVEHTSRSRSVEAIQVVPFGSQVDIRFHCKRKRLIDIDNISVKAVIDGIVLAGLLRDDSPEFVRSVTVSQEKCKPGEEEETEVTLTEVE